MDRTSKKCPRCETVKPRDEFSRNRSASDGLQTHCRECARRYRIERASEFAATARRYYEKTKTDPTYIAKKKKWVRSWKLRRYGLSYERYAELLREQGGCCAICRCPQEQNRGSKNGSRDLCVDHDHATGLVRGLLCHHCNKALGLLRDSPEIAAAAADYLSQSRDRKVA